MTKWVTGFHLTDSHGSSTMDPFTQGVTMHAEQEQSEQMQNPTEFYKCATPQQQRFNQTLIAVLIDEKIHL